MRRKRRAPRITYRNAPTGAQRSITQNRLSEGFMNWRENQLSSFAFLVGIACNLLAGFQTCFALNACVEISAATVEMPMTVAKSSFARKTAKRKGRHRRPVRVSDFRFVARGRHRASTATGTTGARPHRDGDRRGARQDAGPAAATRLVGIGVEAAGIGAVGTGEARRIARMSVRPGRTLALARATWSPIGCAGAARPAFAAARPPGRPRAPPGPPGRAPAGPGRPTPGLLP